MLCQIAVLRHRSIVVHEQTNVKRASGKATHSFRSNEMRSRSLSGSTYRGERSGWCLGWRGPVAPDTAFWSFRRRYAGLVLASRTVGRTVAAAAVAASVAVVATPTPVPLREHLSLVSSQKGRRSAPAATTTTNWSGSSIWSIVARRKSLPLAMTRAAQAPTIEGTSDETWGSRPY